MKNGTQINKNPHNNKKDSKARPSIRRQTKMTTKLAYQELDLPNYRNTKNIFANLDVTDAVKASILAPTNLFIVGNPGTAKTLLANDIHMNYFNGNKREHGQGIFIRANPEMDLYNEIFSELNIDRAQRELTDNIEALLFRVDEINRAPTKTQNQFLALGDGDMDYKGRSIKLGNKGYLLLIATANIGNGRYTGTFDIDPALFDRLHVVLDLDHYTPRDEDHYELDEKEADPRIKDAHKRDITDKIIQASKEIGQATENPGLEARAVINYIRSGLANCMLNSSEGKTSVKGREWPTRCQDCKHNKGANNALCSLIRNPSGRRVTESIMRYAAALEYLAKLKDPKVQIDTIDLMFKSFELVGAYKGLLNPSVLKQEYHENNPLFMAKIVEKLKSDFRVNEDYILNSLEQAQHGKRIVRFFEINGKHGNYDILSTEAQKKHSDISPYTDNRAIGLAWAPKLIDYEIKKAKGKETKQNQIK